jgi:cytoskeleton protein RodZ
MPTVSEQLRAAREAQGLTIYQVADVTKIRTDHLRALEEGRYQAFAAPVYVRGFVRTYARVLRLDPEATLAALELELRQDPKFQDRPTGLARERTLLDVLMLQFSKVNWRVALPSLGLALVVLASIVSYRAWRSHQSRDPLAELGPGLYQPAQPGETLPLPGSNPSP